MRSLIDDTGNPPMDNGTERRAIRAAGFVLAVVGFAVLASCDVPVSPENPSALPPIDVPWTDQQSVVCFGTSLTYGFMWDRPIGFDAGHPPVLSVSPPMGARLVVDTTSYPALLARRLRLPVHRQGFLGATTGRALEVVGDSVFSKNPALVLLEFGANDLLQDIDVHTVERNLGRLIDTLHSVGSRVVLISFLYPEMIETVPADHFLANRKDEGKEYLAMLRRVAGSKRILFVENAMMGIYWNQDLMSDSVHPNRRGYQVMEENIYRALEYTFRKNSMMRDGAI